MDRSAFELGALLTLLAAAGCSSVRAGGPDAGTPAAACAVGGRQHSSGDTLSVAVTEPVDPSKAPAPTNGAEQLVFAQLYETLIDVDCHGRARPAVARSWTMDATRTRVTLTIRDDVRFWSGAPLTANDVVAAWRATSAHLSESGRLARDIANATTVVDDRTLTISLADTAWLVLADRALAIYRPLAPSVQAAAGWPEGSGRYRPAINARAPDMLLAPRSPADPYLMIRQARGDARDAIDAGADVLVTGDPSAMSYAASRTNLSVVPLPWIRTYALAVPRAAGERESRTAALPDSGLARVRASMAHDAVRADARPALPSSWLDAGTSCGMATSGTNAGVAAPVRGSRRVVHRAGDRVAQALAERLVALERGAVATALASNDFARALRTAEDLGYVLEVPHAPLSPCRALLALYSAAPWLARDEGTHLVPLIDVREHAIIKRNGISAIIGWDGTLTFGNPGRRP